VEAGKKMVGLNFNQVWNILDEKKLK